MSDNFNIWITHESVPVILALSPRMLNTVHEKTVAAPHDFISSKEQR